MLEGLKTSYSASSHMNSSTAQSVLNQIQAAIRQKVEYLM